MLDRNTLSQVLKASRSLHGSGSMSPAALLTIAKHLEPRNPRYTVETGTGASTLIFSQISRDHTVFTVNTDGSMNALLASPLLRRDTTKFVEGPTQKTLPLHAFGSKLQAVLLDGPHAYPFPDLEYFYLYPHIEENGLLIIDDIHIPSIYNLFRFLCKEEMFRLLEVSGKTAFFARTASPVFDPWSDGWWLQEFNRRVLRRYSLQDRLKSVIPLRWRPRLRTLSDGVRLWYRGSN